MILLCFFPMTKKSYSSFTLSKISTSWSVGTGASVASTFTGFSRYRKASSLCCPASHMRVPEVTISRINSGEFLTTSMFSNFGSGVLNTTTGVFTPRIKP